MNTRIIRDVVTILVGSGLLISQVVLQFTDRSPDLAIVAAALSLLGVVPLFQLGDRQSTSTSNGSPSGRPKHVSN